MKKANRAAKAYKPEPREREIVEAFFARRKAQKPAPELTVVEKKAWQKYGSSIRTWLLAKC
jgi:hypothetical protein